MFSSLNEINEKYKLNYISSAIDNDIIKIFNGEQIKTTDKQLYLIMGDYQKYVMKNIAVAKTYYDLSKENKIVICICGEEVKKANYSKHILTKKHLNIVEKIGTNNAMQELFITSPIQDAILIGNPGCGKTRTIINYCIDKFKKGLIDNHSNILIISFSKKAQGDFIIRGKKSLKPQLFNNKNVRTFHSLAYSILTNLMNINSSTTSLNTIILSARKFLEGLANNALNCKILNDDNLLENNVLDNLLDDNNLLDNDNLLDDDNLENKQLISDFLDNDFQNDDLELKNEIINNLLDNDFLNNDTIDNKNTIENDNDNNTIDNKNTVKNDNDNDNNINNVAMKISDVLTALKSLSEFKNCKFIFVDEAQDINENQYSLIDFCSKVLGIPLILVGDPNQNIFQFQGGTDKYLVEHIVDGNNNNNIKNKPIFNLTDNYRSTSEIIDFINELRPYKKLFPPMNYGKRNNPCCNDNKNPKPIIFNGSYNEILEHIKNEILTTVNREEIAIIGSVKKAKAIPSKDGSRYNNIGLQLICNYLNTHNIDFVKHYNEDSGETACIKDNFEIKKGYVNILTAHGSKGLEFGKVLVINYHFRTQSKEPTNEEYENFKFLWYVALSRAIDKMIIYVDETKEIFKQIHDLPKHLYTVEGKGFANIKSNFTQPMVESEFSITKIINDNKYFNENVLYDFCQTFKYELTSSTLYENILDLNNIAIYEHSKFACLYGEFMELLFMFYYYKNKDKTKEFIQTLKNNLINSNIFVDNRYSSIINSLSKKGIIDFGGCFYFDEIDKTKLSACEYEFIVYCHSVIKNNKINVFIKVDLFEYDEEYIVNLIDSLENSKDSELIIFKIKLYFYQIENECKYLLSYDFTQNLKSLSIYYDKMNKLAKKCDNFEFQVRVKHININIIGFIDILHNNKIIELKFVTAVSEKHVIQTLLYYNNKFQNWIIPKDIEIWNFFNGLCYKPIFSENTTNWKLNSFLCKVLKIKMRKNVFMLDLETNEKIVAGVLPDMPNPYTNEIIDRFVYEYNLNYIASDGLIKNKFPLTTSHINGIYQTDLNKQTTDDNLFIFKQDMENILKVCENPIIIAHNGCGFDFIVLEQNGLINNEFTKLDSKKFLKLLIPDNHSQKLVDIYNFIFKTNMIQTHRAKGDTMMIAEICRKLELVADDFVKMINCYD